jgi:hypothetical protein
MGFSSSENSSLLTYASHSQALPSNSLGTKGTLKHGE